MSITIPDVPTIASYTVGSTPQTVFPVPYPFFAATDLVVTVNGAARTLNTHYTVSGAGVTEGGTVTFLAAVTNAEVVIRRDIPVERLTDLPESGALLIRSLNLDLDRMVALIQQVRDSIALNEVAAEAVAVTPGGGVLSTTVAAALVELAAGIAGRQASSVLLTALAGLGAGLGYVRKNGADDFVVEATVPQSSVTGLADALGRLFDAEGDAQVKRFSGNFSPTYQYDGGAGRAGLVAVEGTSAAPTTNAGAQVIAQKFTKANGGFEENNTAGYFAITRSAPDAAMQAGTHVSSVLAVAHDNTGGATSFVEAGRFESILFNTTAGSKQGGAAYGIVAVAGCEPAVPYEYLVAEEAQVINKLADAPTILDNEQFAACYVATAGLIVDPTVVASAGFIIDAAYMVNPWNARAARVGYLVPKSQYAAGGFRTVTEACFRAAEDAVVGIDLSGAFTGAAIRSGITGTSEWVHFRRTGSSNPNRMRVEGEAAVSIQARRASDDTLAPNIALQKARGTLASPAALQNSDVLGQIFFQGTDSGAVNRTGARITAAVSAAPGSGSLPADLLVEVNQGGADVTETVRFQSSGAISHRGATVIVDASSHLGLRSYTVATLPSAATSARLIYVSDGTSNQRLAVSDGTNWRFPSGAIVS